MWLINLCAVFCVAAALARWFHKPIVYTVPVTLCALMVVLQFLAYAGMLSAIDWIAAAICAAFVIEWCCRKRKISEMKDLILSADLILLLGAVIFTAVLHWDTPITDYDDYNYWAVSVKSLFFRDGMEAMHRQVAFLYGDYPLGIQLIQWWLMHLLGRWEERMLFMGCGFFLYSCIVPLFAGVRTWKKVPLCLAVVLLIPYTAYVFPYRLAPDACMGAAYALAQVFCIRAVSEKDDTWFYPVAIGLLCAALTMIKSVGILWAAFVWIFWLLLKFLSDGVKLRGIAETAVVILPGFAMWKLWQRVCYLLERTTYLTTALQENKLALDQGHIDRANIFWDGILREPYRTLPLAGLPISLLIYFLAACGALWFFTHKVIATTKEKRTYNAIWGFTLVSTAAYMIIILYSILTMFYGETQYENRSLMFHALILRYGCPSIYAFLIITLESFLQYKKLYKPEFKQRVFSYIVIACLLAVHVVPAVQSIETQSQNSQWVRSMIAEIQEKNSGFLSAREALPDPLDSKVLYCDPDESASVWTGVVMEYSSEGTAVMYSKELNPETLWRTIFNFHITHIYVSSESETGTMDYSSLAGGEEFLYNTMYRVEDADIDYVLLVPEASNLMQD